MALGLFVLLGIVITGQIAQSLSSANQAEATTAFSQLADRVTDRIGERIRVFEYGLRGGRGAFVVDPHLDLTGWRDYIASRDIDAEFFGALGFGYIARIPRAAVSSYVNVMRETFEDFKISTLAPAGDDHPDLFVIQYIDPIERNRAAPGLDIGSEANRREAAERAMRTGKPALSAPIDLLQAKRPSPGFLYLIPVYTLDAPTATEADRIQSLRGWVYAPIVMDQAMAGIAAMADDLIDFEVFDGEELAKEKPLFHSLTAPHSHANRPFATRRILALGGRRWTIHVRSTAAFESKYTDQTTWLCWTIGLALTGAVLGVLWSLSSSRRRARAMARVMIVELEQQNDELEKARRDAIAATLAKSQFLANMSHELRTPMTSILGFAQFLAEPEIEPAERIEHASIILRNGDHMLALINEVLDFSKIEAGRMEVEHIPTSVISIVKDVHAALRHRAEHKGLRLTVVWCSKLPEQQLTDPTRVRQILMNLVGNAIKFTDHGSVQIAVAHETHGEQQRLLLRILDTGAGLTAEQQERLFQPFTQADASTTRKHGGTGLGLSISKQLAQLLGGDIHAQCEIGRGCAFVLELPLEAPEGTNWILPQDAPALPRTPAAVEKRELRGRVLLVDDGADNRQLISAVLRRAGAIVEVAENGQQAVHRALAEHAAGCAFDLILMDMQMPEKDGPEATRELRAAGVTTPIVALTANLLPEDEVRCRMAGSNGFLSKPLDRTRFLATCAQFLGT